MAQTEELLTEIRDLLRAQQETLQRTHRMTKVAMIVKIVFYVAIIIFSIWSAFIYAQTIMQMTTGL